LRTVIDLGVREVATRVAGAAERHDRQVLASPEQAALAAYRRLCKAIAGALDIQPPPKPARTRPDVT
jgi:hypothetical protein